MLRRIQAVPAQRVPATGVRACVAFGRCQLDLDSHQLFDPDGAEIPITTMEFDLLRLFAENPNKALSRDRILNLTHNRDWEPFDRSIDIRIARLRRKIRARRGKPPDRARSATSATCSYRSRAELARLFLPCNTARRAGRACLYWLAWTPRRPTRADSLTAERSCSGCSSATPVVFAKDPDGRYLFVNREWERVHWGRTGDVTGLTDFDIFPAEVAARYRENDLLVLGDECAHQFEETVVVDGIERTYVTAKFPLLDASGLPYAVCGMATDITERRRIEDALSSAALAVSSSEGGALFSELVRYLATILDVDSAFISKPVDGGDTMRMLAIHLNGETREHFDYSIAGTACQTVMSKGFGVYQSGLAELLGAKRRVLGMRPGSYAGCRLNDSAGRPVGVLAVVSRRPIENPVFRVGPPDLRGAR